MNRTKKEELKKYNEVTKHMTKDEKKKYDMIMSYKEKFEKLISELHGELFSEEYDFMCDDGVDADRRRRGVNPMSDEYIERNDKKRVLLGFLPLAPNGHAKDTKETLEYCKKLVIGEIDINKDIIHILQG